MPRRCGLRDEQGPAPACGHGRHHHPDGAGPVTVTVTDSVAVIDLDDGKASALGFDVLARARSALDRAEADDVSAIVIVGREEVLRRLRPEGDDLRVPRAHATCSDAEPCSACGCPMFPSRSCWP